MLLTSSDTKRTLMHLLLFTNSAQRELVSICTQSIHDRNWLSLPYILGADDALLKFIAKGLNPIVYMQNHRMEKKRVYLSLFANYPCLNTVKNCINILFIGHLNTSCFKSFFISTFNVFRVYNNNKVEILSRV